MIIFFIQPVNSEIAYLTVVGWEKILGLATGMELVFYGIRM